MAYLSVDRDRNATLGSPKLDGLGDVVFYDAPKPNDWEISGPLGPIEAAGRQIRFQLKPWKIVTLCGHWAP